jgi:hypothetical protein
MNDFFTNMFQNSLKKQAMLKNNDACTIEDYIKTLKDYKILFFDELSAKGNNITMTNCVECCDIFERDMYQNILDDKVDWLENCFDEIISMLTIYVENKLETKNKLKKYIDTKCTGWSVSGAIELAKPMFRARRIGTYERHIHELYHVPFSRTDLLSDERFSSIAKPMLYLSETIEGTLYETHLKFDEANYALFVPKFSNFYRRVSYNINNTMQTNLDSIIMDARQGCKMEYDNDFSTFSKENISEYLAEFVLYQILLFPVCEECRKDRAKYPQYILPQVIMEIMAKRNMLGIIYHSANGICNRGYDQYKNQHDNNLCLNIPETEEYNEQYLNNFFTALWFQGDGIKTINEARNLLKECVEIARPQHQRFIMNDYSRYLSAIELHMEYMEKVVKHYAVSPEGQVEATLFYDFMEQIKPILKEPEKYNVLKWEDISR